MTSRARRERRPWPLIGACALALLCLLASRTFDAGAATRAKPAPERKVSLLYVLNARRATLAPLAGGGYRLAVLRPQRDVDWFSDRPARRSGAFPARALADHWAGFGFAADPPNVALDYVDAHGEDRTAILELRRPRLRGRSIVFAARLLDPATVKDPNLAAHAAAADREPPRQLRDVALFVDDALAEVVDGCVLQPYSACEGTSFGNDFPQADLSGADLAQARFGEGVIYESDLSKADLREAEIEDPVLNTNLSGANLSESRIGGVILESDDLSGADLSGADVEAMFQHSNLSGADVEGVSWSGALFCATTMPDGTVNNSGCKAIREEEEA